MRDGTGRAKALNIWYLLLRFPSSAFMAFSFNDLYRVVGGNLCATPVLLSDKVLDSPSSTKKCAQCGVFADQVAAEDEQNLLLAIFTFFQLRTPWRRSCDG